MNIPESVRQDSAERVMQVRAHYADRASGTVNSRLLADAATEVVLQEVHAQLSELVTSWEKRPGFTKAAQELRNFIQSGAQA